MNDIKLQLSDVTKSFDTNGTKHDVLDNLSLKITTGTCLGILGKSGVGKSTLLELIAGLINYDSGHTSFDKGSEKQAILVFQDYSKSVFPHLTVKENVELAISEKYTIGKECDKVVIDSLEICGLGHVLEHYPWQLSGGMQQRLVIARAIALKPEVLLLDEPYASLDFETKFKLEDDIYRLKSELDLTIIQVTHDIDSALYSCDRIVILGGTPAKITYDQKINLPRFENSTKTRNSDEFLEHRKKLMEVFLNA